MKQMIISAKISGMIISFIQFYQLIKLVFGDKFNHLREYIFAWIHNLYSFYAIKLLTQFKSKNQRALIINYLSFASKY